MTLIDGVGDEVTFIVVTLLVLTFLFLAWLSTSVNEYSWVQTVLSAATYLNSEEANEQLLANDLAPQDQDSPQGPSEVPRDAAQPSTGEHREVVEDLNSQCRKRNVVHQSKDAGSSSSADRNVAKEQDNVPVATVEDTTEVVDDNDTVPGNIQVRLKFLNDTLRHVDAHLEEQLGSFKRRHFAEELSSNKIVRLIFNGHLLQQDQETLQHHGLFDNCVVHCQISTTANRAPTSVPIPVELDLSRLMFPMFGILIGLLWCCRIQYRQYFNTTSTFGLVCITGLFVLSVATLLMPARHRTR